VLEQPALGVVKRKTTAGLQLKILQSPAPEMEVLRISILTSDMLLLKPRLLHQHQLVKQAVRTTAEMQLSQEVPALSVLEGSVHMS
jgi:hypothetical protein